MKLQAIALILLGMNVFALACDTETVEITREVQVKLEVTRGVEVEKQIQVEVTPGRGHP